MGPWIFVNNNAASPSKGCDCAYCVPNSVNTSHPFFGMVLLMFGTHCTACCRESRHDLRAFTIIPNGNCSLSIFVSSLLNNCTQLHAKIARLRLPWTSHGSTEDFNAGVRIAATEPLGNLLTSKQFLRNSKAGCCSTTSAVTSPRTSHCPAVLCSCVAHTYMVSYASAVNRGNGQSAPRPYFKLYPACLTFVVDNCWLYSHVSLDYH